jgi:glycosyl transferase family 87
MVPARVIERRRQQRTSETRGFLARFIDVEPAPEPVDARGIPAWLLTIVFLAAAVFVSIYAVDRSVDELTANNHFAAYYCAGSVARVGGDPYAAQPLEQCHNGASSPVPLPGYAIAFFSAVSLAPYRAAAIGWEMLLLLALFVTVWAIWRASCFPVLAVAAGVVGTDLVAGLTFGQISVLTTLGVALTAYFLQRDRQIPAAFASLLTLLQPQIGIPVALALLLWTSRARWVLLALLALAGVLSYVHLGANENLEYFQRALPIHAVAEVPLLFQYSLTWIAYFFGSDEVRALQLGVIQYSISALLGVSIAPFVARRLESPAVLAALPAAAAVVGGPSVHLSDLAAAIPFAAIVAASQVRVAGLGRIALVLLSAAWIALLTWEQALLGGVAAGIATVYGLVGRPRLVRIGAAVAILALTLVFPSALAHVSRSDVTATGWEAFALKAPDWLALVLLYLAALAVLPSRRRTEPEERMKNSKALRG